MDYQSVLAQKALQISTLKARLQNIETSFKEKQEELDRNKELLQALQNQNSRLQVR